MPWIDIGVLVLILIFGIVGISRGFLRSLLALFSSLVTLILAIWLAKPVAGVVDSLFGLSNAFAGMLEPGFLETFTGWSGSGWLAEVVKIILGADALTLEAPELASQFAGAVGNIISIAICAVVLYFVIRFILFLLGKLFRTITQNRAINGLDRILGFVIGAAKGVLAVFIICGLMFVLGSIIPGVASWTDQILGANTVARTLYGWSVEILETTIIPFFTG